MTIAPNISQNELRALASDVVRLSRLLTREREVLPEAYLKDGGLRKAYRAYFLPANLSKIHKPLQELLLHPRGLFSKEKIRILDIGAGPGTAVLGTLEFFSRRKQKPVLAFTAVDQVLGNLKEAEELFLFTRNKHALDASLKTIQADIGSVERFVHGHFDMIILSNVLNELFVHDEKRIATRVEFLDSILKRFLADDGSCIIIEPALRETSRDVLEVRDGILGLGFNVYSPCLGGVQCPALANIRDWCHEDIPWEPPLRVQEIDKLTGLRKDSLKFSYLVLRRDALSLADICGPSAFRVVSEPLVSKGKVEFYLCAGGERKLVTRLDKDSTDRNHDFRRLKRGDVVDIEELKDEGKRFRVGKDTTVKLLPHSQLRPAF
jgi:ribosomal protein RSM22 (predicted rRNA methylase)